MAAMKEKSPRINLYYDIEHIIVIRFNFVQ
jgi:hypothetical protein